MTAQHLDELIRLLRDGSPPEPVALVAATTPELVRLASSRLRDRAAVDDVVQESLLEIIDSYEALRNPDAFRTWLRLIVHKQVDRVTRRQRDTAVLDSAADHIRDPHDGPERLVERRGDVAMIQRALAVVDDADALLLRLRYAGEWSDAELADLVRTSPGTIRKRLFDARRRLRAAVLAPPGAPPNESMKEHPLTTAHDYLGRVLAADEVTLDEAAPLRTPAPDDRLETGLKVLDAVLPIQRGGTVDLLGPAGLGHLVLVVEIAVQVGAVVVAAGPDDVLSLLVEDPTPGVRAAVVRGGERAASTAAAGRLATALAASGETVMLVFDAPAWDAGSPPHGLTGDGSVTAFRFAPHPRDGKPGPAAPDAGTSLVFAVEPFVQGLYPALDVLASRSSLIEAGALDPVTVGAAHAAREVLQRSVEIRRFLAQPLKASEPFTGVPGEQIPARRATEELATLVR